MIRTKFILHGGSSKDETNEDYQLFFAEVLKDTLRNVKILLVPFAKDDDRVLSATEKIKNEFGIVREDKELQIDVATKDRFLDQLKNSDVIYLHGGVSLKLLEALKKYENISQYFEGKTIVGESAGANVLGTYFYSPHADKVFRGLDILPVKIIPHYTQDQKEKLNGVGVDLEEVFLPEYILTKYFINNPQPRW